MTGRVQEVNQSAIFSKVVNIDPGLNSAMSIVDDIPVVVPDEFLRDRRCDARRNFVEVLQKAKPPFTTAIV